MQKAINIPEIVESYYNGGADPTLGDLLRRQQSATTLPTSNGQMTSNNSLFTTLRRQRGFLMQPGILVVVTGIRFESNWDVFPPWGHDIDLSLIVASYWEKVGVKVTITQVAEDSEMSERRTNAEYGGMTSCGCRHKKFQPNGFKCWSVWRAADMAEYWYQ